MNLNLHSILVSISKMTETEPYDFIIVGGGIAAVACAEELSNFTPRSILIIAASPLVKATSNAQKRGIVMESFDVEERQPSQIFGWCPNVTVVTAVVRQLFSEMHEVEVDNGKRFKYSKLCICTGGKAKIIHQNPHVVGIRDTQSVKDFQSFLKNVSRIVIVGNGGIATELVYEVENVEVIWAVKHNSISATFVDAGAAEFFLKRLMEPKVQEKLLKRTKYTTSPSDATAGVTGSALGPDWVEDLQLCGSLASKKVHIELQCSVDAVLTPGEPGAKNITHIPGFMEKDDWPVYVTLNGKTYGCDLIINAVGVEIDPSLWLNGNKFNVAHDGGLLVDTQMHTNIDDVYAAGDVCSVGWTSYKHWFQMRLWTQARQMGTYTARSMLANIEGKQLELDICFEIFTHVTRFFGYKVILLGCFNGQGLTDHEALLRVSKGVEYVKILVADGKVHGAILVGETDLEETIENLILNQIDISDIKDDLLNPTVDIEDYFD